MNLIPIDLSGIKYDLLHSSFRGKIRLIGRYLNWLYFQTREKIMDKKSNVFDLDWDNLIILDACRDDLFYESSGLQNFSSMEITKDSRITNTSNTIEFLRKNISDKKLHDTVYVTANPQYRKFQNELDAEFHDVIDLWDFVWDEKINTVLPETTVKQAIETASKYPQKRLLIHFNQPHIPFFGEIGRSNFDLEVVAENPLPFWKQPMLTDQKIEDEIYWGAYKENLELTLPHVGTLISKLQGKTIITADHGNMVGDRGFPVPTKEYGHPGGIHYPELVSVPWLEVENGSRKNVRSEPPRKEETEISEEIESRLEDLGYA